ncbi:hypothetical protein BDA99DRAFT_601695 [Phascolomyces articulosus]|uniref:Uncharacterized protein n=1 Tax=Phascolomyces articulosus TaxID=60185 RepID=A0AAD5KRP9_9FUNG|nr:hypothetical protein BDA99DRAFT_601695 [Phascolomyces articulosus]
MPAEEPSLQPASRLSVRLQFCSCFGSDRMLPQGNHADQSSAYPPLPVLGSNNHISLVLKYVSSEANIGVNHFAIASKDHANKTTFTPPFLQGRLLAVRFATQINIQQTAPAVISTDVSVSQKFRRIGIPKIPVHPAIKSKQDALLKRKILIYSAANKTTFTPPFLQGRLLAVRFATQTNIQQTAPAVISTDVSVSQKFRYTQQPKVSKAHR